MGDQRRAGMIQLQVNGEIQDAKGEFDYGLGQPKRTAIIGADRVHGYTEEPQVAYIEGKITDRNTLDVEELVKGKGLTVTLSLANGKVISLRDAWYAGDGKVNTKEAEIEVRWEGASPAKEVS
jgi:hypothetical protein